MYRLNYTNLNMKQVEDILSKNSPPTSASAFCTCLVGKTIKIVLDKLPVEGPVLEYEFPSEIKLTLKENGGTAVSCDYGAHSLKDITLFSHMIPGTKRGYTVIVNWETSVVAAFEMWFVDYEGQPPDTSIAFVPVAEMSKQPLYVNREVQRQYYFGYIEVQGETPTENRPKLTLQIENTMIKWKEDRGKKWLTTYTSAIFSTFVELDVPDGGDVLTFVSDLLQIDDSTYIHCYGEVEYSGRLTIEVFDLFSMKKIGVSMGIDEKDALEHTLYKGYGRYLGRIAAFYDFNDKGETHSAFANKRYDFSMKGARYTYRPSIMTKKLTKEDIVRILEKPLIFNPERAKERNMTSDHTLPDTGYCIGKALTFRGDDGLAVEMRFQSITELEYRIEGEKEWRLEQYRATELDEDFIVFAYFRSGMDWPAHFVFALDFKNGLATCISSKMGTKWDLHDPEPHYHFGIFEAEGVKPTRIYRHGFTTDLLGRAYTQTYGDNKISIHIYNAPHSYSWTVVTSTGAGTPGNRAGGPVWSSPCEYLKFRDDIYCMSWIEQKWSGGMDSLFRNFRTGRDCGFSYGIAHDGSYIHLDKMGAKSRYAGYIDLSGVYPLRNYNPLS